MSIYYSTPPESSRSLTYPEKSDLPELHEFWERGFVKPAVSFNEQLRDLQNSEDVRDTIITAQPDTIVGINSTGRSKLFFTEKEGLLDLSHFLDVVNQQAGDESTASAFYNTSQKMQKLAGWMRKELIFLRQQEYDEACLGLAYAWRAYVTQSSEHIINIFAPDTYGDVSNNKSYDIVLQDIVHTFNRITGNELEVKERLKLSPESWKATDTAKLVVVDDWIISGHTLRTNMQRAITAARNAGVPTLDSKTEAHVLIARGDYIANGLEIPSQDNENTLAFPVKGYFAAGEIAEAIRGTPISGSHSSVDYNFEGPLSWMQDYLHSKGIYRELPLLARIQRRYQEEAQIYDPQAVVLLGKIATLNATIDKLQTEMAIFHNTTSIRAHQASLGRSYLTYDAMIAATEERKATVRAYNTYLKSLYY